MKGHTLADRLAVVQSGLTLLALAAVVVGTWLGLTSLLQQRRDATLNEAAQRGVEVARMLGVYAQDAEWMERELEEIRPSSVRLELQDPTGFVLASSGPGFDPGPVRLGCHDSAALRACAAKSGIFTIRASSDKTPDIEERARYLFAMLVASVMAGALVLLTSRRVARRTLQPLLRLTDAVARIQPGKGGRLGPALEFAELDRLRERFDELLERFEQALARERRLTAQASHELRTPLAVARGELEALTATDLERGKARATGALDRLVELVEVLLWFARVQEPLERERMGIVNVSDLIRAELDERRPLLRQTVLACQLPDEALVHGDELLLRRVTTNLIDNAVKHGDSLWIGVAAWAKDSRLVVEVSNTGPRLPTAMKASLFEPFFRGEQASLGVSGFGLGLPFARAVARAHGGDIELAETRPELNVFVWTLPLVAYSGHSDSAAPNLAAPIQVKTSASTSSSAPPPREASEAPLTPTSAINGN